MLIPKWKHAAAVILMEMQQMNYLCNMPSAGTYVNAHVSQEGSSVALEGRIPRPRHPDTRRALRLAMMFALFGFHSEQWRMDTSRNTH